MTQNRAWEQAVADARLLMADGYQPAPYDSGGEGKDEPVTCPRCGKGDARDAKYCDQCGFHLAGAQGVKINAAESDDPDKEWEKQVSKRDSTRGQINRLGKGKITRFSPGDLVQDGAGNFGVVRSVDPTHVYVHPHPMHGSNVPEQGTAIEPQHLVHASRQALRTATTAAKKISAAQEAIEQTNRKVAHMTPLSEQAWQAALIDAAETLSLADLKGPRHGGDAQTLRDYWSNHPTKHGKVSGITWGVPGDFDQCVARTSKFMLPEKAKGYCALRHHQATGAWPGHAPAEQAMKHAEPLTDAEIECAVAAEFGEEGPQTLNFSLMGRIAAAVKGEARDSHGRWTKGGSSAPPAAPEKPSLPAPEKPKAAVPAQRPALPERRPGESPIDYAHRTGTTDDPDEQFEWEEHTYGAGGRGVSQFGKGTPEDFRIGDRVTHRSGIPLKVTGWSGENIEAVGEGATSPITQTFPARTLIHSGYWNQAGAGLYSEALSPGAKTSVQRAQRMKAEAQRKLTTASGDDAALARAQIDAADKTLKLLSQSEGGLHMADDDSGSGMVDCPVCKGKGTIRDGHVRCPGCKGKGEVTPARKAQMHERAREMVFAGGGTKFDPDGDGDDDSSPETDTDHDVWNPDGSLTAKGLRMKAQGKLPMKSSEHLLGSDRWL